MRGSVEVDEGHDRGVRGGCCRGVLGEERQEVAEEGVEWQYGCLFLVLANVSMGVPGNASSHLPDGVDLICLYAQYVLFFFSFGRLSVPFAD